MNSESRLDRVEALVEHNAEAIAKNTRNLDRVTGAIESFYQLQQA
jgi:hypothetical protein